MDKGPKFGYYHCNYYGQGPNLILGGGSTLLLNPPPLARSTDSQQCKAGCKGNSWQQRKATRAMGSRDSKMKAPHATWPRGAGGSVRGNFRPIFEIKEFGAKSPSNRKIESGVKSP